MIFSSPLYFLFILLFALVYLYKKFYKKRFYINYPNINHLKDLPRPSLLSYLPFVLCSLAVLSLVVGLASPQLGVTETKTEKLTLEIMMTLDLSGSMEYGGKMSTLRHTAKEFAKSMQDHRLGVTIYSDNAYLWCPPTDDLKLLGKFLDRASPSVLGGMTAIGKGMLVSTYTMLEPLSKGLSVALLKKVAQKDVSTEFLQEKTNRAFPFKGKVIVLFTDGQQNTGIEPTLVASLARELGIRVYYLKVGDSDYADHFKLVKAVGKTGGKYYQMEDMEGLAEAYQEISTLEKGRTVVKSQRKYYPLYPYFLAGGLGLFGVGMGLKKTIFLEVS